MNPEHFVRLRIFGRPGATSFYLWGVVGGGRKVWLATLETDATTAGYMASAVAWSMGLSLELAGAGQ